jgi:hypothetical protein
VLDSIDCGAVSGQPIFMPAARKAISRIGVSARSVFDIAWVTQRQIAQCVVGEQIPAYRQSR